jgi:hypothetical protein
MAPAAPGAGAERRSPAELGGRLDRILAVAGQLVTRIPDDRMAWTPPQLPMALGDLGFHVFRLGLAFADGMDMGGLRETWLQESAPPDLRDGASVARYGALVRGRLAGWFEGAGSGEYARVIDVAGEARSGLALLVGTARHAAQHVRQLHAVLEALGVAPLGSLAPADLAGLGLPSRIW